MLEARVRAFGGGDLIACSALQEGLDVFETSFGSWAFRRVAGMDMTLGEPLCALEDREEMIRRFLLFSRRPTFFYVRDAFLRLLKDSGLYAVGIGVDRHVDVGALLASPGKSVRGALKKARRSGVRWDEVALGSLSDGLRRRIGEINVSYLSRAEIGVEMRFLNRPMSLEEDGLRRVFLMRREDREGRGVFGFVVLNPVFDQGRRCGWLLDILRFEPSRVWGLWLSTVHTLAERVAVDGEGFSLGYCPMFGVSPAPVLASRSLRVQMDWMVKYLSSTPYLARLRDNKVLIQGVDEPRYLASFSRSLPRVLYVLCEAMGFDFRGLFGADLIKIVREGARGGG